MTGEGESFTRFVFWDCGNLWIAPAGQRRLVKA